MLWPKRHIMFFYEPKKRRENQNEWLKQRQRG